jgi:RimJ/RimL family protein N-acetyltransferase
MATVLFENRPMQKVFERLGFRMKQTSDNDSLEAELTL